MYVCPNGCIYALLLNLAKRFSVYVGPNFIWEQLYKTLLTDSSP